MYVVEVIDLYSITEEITSREELNKAKCLIKQAFVNTTFRGNKIKLVKRKSEFTKIDEDINDYAQRLFDFWY